MAIYRSGMGRVPDVLSADVVFTRLDWHEEIPSTVDSTLPRFVKSENAGEVAVRDKID